MTLAKKGKALRRRRGIVVDGERFRWVVVPDDEPGLAIVVEPAEGHGQRMVTWVEHGTLIAPGLVAEIIRKALGDGWIPQQRGNQIEFRVLDADRVSMTFTPWPPPKFPR